VSDTLIVTEKAAEKVWQLIQEEGNNELKLRVYVTGGGCSGFQYGFIFEEKSNPDDAIIEKQIDTTALVQFLIDPVSYTYLSGAEIDYKDDIEG
jgi:iron-sulfur cluster insertion protein